MILESLELEESRFIHYTEQFRFLRVSFIAYWPFLKGNTTKMTQQNFWACCTLHKEFYSAHFHFISLDVFQFCSQYPCIFSNISLLCCFQYRPHLYIFIARFFLMSFSSHSYDLMSLVLTLLFCRGDCFIKCFLIWWIYVWSHTLLYGNIIQVLFFVCPFSF